MNKLWLLTLAVSLAAGCEKKKAPTAEQAAAAGAATDGGAAQGAAAAAAPAPVPTGPSTVIKYADTSNLWAMAPADATFGLVVADGVGPRALDLVNRGRAKLEGKPFARKLTAQIDAWRKEQPFDVFDAAAYKTKGWDISKGVAVYGGADTSRPLLLVLPVTDLQSFKDTVKDADGTIEKIGDREVYKSKELLCTLAAGRYVCGRSLEEIDAAVKPHDSPLAAAVKALPADARGDVEGYIDITKTPDAQKSLTELKQVGDFTTAGGALRLDAVGMNLNLWAKGAISPLVSGFAASAPPAELAGMTANATTVMRMKFDPKLLLMKAPPSMPFGTADVRTDLLDQLTGDAQIVTAGKGLLAGAIMLKVNDTAKVKKVVAALCAEAQKGGQLPVTGIVAKEDSCAGEVSLAALKDAIGMELPPFKFNFAVTGPTFVAVLGDLDPATLKGSAVDDAGSAEAKDALGGPQTFAVWTRGLGIDVGALPKELADKVNAETELAEALALLNWSGGQAYELSMAASVTQGGARLTVHVTSMSADAADARTAYEVALDKKISGDRAGYTAALAEIESKFPTSLAAKRAKLERTGTPIAGPVSGVVAGSVASFYFMMRAAGASLPQIPGSGSFGEPGATPSEPAPPAEPAAPEKAPEPAPSKPTP